MDFNMISDVEYSSYKGDGENSEKFCQISHTRNSQPDNISSVRKGEIMFQIKQRNRTMTVVDVVHTFSQPHTRVIIKPAIDEHVC